MLINMIFLTKVLVFRTSFRFVIPIASDKQYASADDIVVETLLVTSQVQPVIF